MVKQQTHYVGDACDGGHRRERTMTIEPRPLTAELFWIVFDGPPGPEPGRFVEVESIAELEGVLRSTHDTYCDEAWTSRGLHAPQCLSYRT